MDAMDIDVDRPTKRQRLSSCLPESGCTLLSEPLPLPVLLLSLPNLLLHPPTHRNYARSVYLSILALQRCLLFPNLDPDVECKAWTGLAELAFRTGLSIEAMEHQAEKAATKALLLAQNHPSLRPYRVHLTLLSARISQHQNNFKFSQNTLRRLLGQTLSPQDPPHLIYTSHLGYIGSLCTPDGNGALVPTVKSLGAIQQLHEAGTMHGHLEIVKLASILRLRTLVQMGAFEQVREALDYAEQLLEFPSQDPTVLSERAKEFAQVNRESSGTAFMVYVLILGAVYYSHIGDVLSTDARTKVLHEMLDGSYLDLIKPHGVFQIPFPGSQALYVQTTHPRVIFALAFLISSVAKRDPVGRKPKRKVFAAEGLLFVERELKRELAFPPWISEEYVLEQLTRFKKIKADLLCEIIGVCVMRSEFGEAEKTLAELIAYARNEDLYNYYAARITLLQAQLSHALGHAERALQCYQVAAYLSRGREERSGKSTVRDDDGMEDQWIHAASRAGELWMRIGILKERIAEYPALTEEEYANSPFKVEENDLSGIAGEVLAVCDGLGGALSSIACVLRACLSAEFLNAKMYLREGLKIATSGGDNHLRALILSLIAAQYLSTSMEHAGQMLVTAEQLAAGLGAQPTKKDLSANTNPQEQKKLKRAGDGVGNAPLRLWLAQRMLELKKRVGDEDGARNLEILIAKLHAAVTKISQRASMFAPPPVKAGAATSTAAGGIDIQNSLPAFHFSVARLRG
ncbi:hypothetical protein FA15DRAFT_645318 [Coprinopsis marcescibilis]|uniref:Uncharacterized protein n=1 Tax=Coprinopsis marcescibilis TaxID=230819 RepID=A0A5C3KMP0_COPMA|nr:hypothetical protein FA15DRAFT_645318 [Coprinopsis marcescibilis]